MSTLNELLQKADSYKQKISSARPLAKEELKSLDDYFRIGFAECVIETERDYCRLLKL